MAICFLHANKENSWAVDTLSPKHVRVTTNIIPPESTLLLPNQFLETADIKYKRQTEVTFSETTSNFSRVTIHMPAIHTKNLVADTFIKCQVWINDQLVGEHRSAVFIQDEHTICIGHLRSRSKLRILLETQGTLDYGNFGSKDVVMTIPLEHAHISPITTEFEISTIYSGKTVFTRASQGQATVTETEVKALAQKWDLRWQKEYVLRLMPAIS